MNESLINASHDTETRFNNLSIRIKNIKLVDWTSIAFLSVAFLLSSAGFSSLTLLLKTVYTTFGYPNYVFLLLMIFCSGNILGSFAGDRMIGIFKHYKTSLSVSAFMLFFSSATIYLNLSFISGEYSLKLEILWMLLPIIGIFVGGVGYTMLWVLQSHYLNLCINPFNDYFLTKIFWSIYSFYHLIGFVVCYFFINDVDFFNFLEILGILQLLSVIMFCLAKEPDLRSREETHKLYNEYSLREIFAKRNLLNSIEKAAPTPRYSFADIRKDLMRNELLSLLPFVLTHALIFSYTAILFPSLVTETFEMHHHDELDQVKDKYTLNEVKVIHNVEVYLIFAAFEVITILTPIGREYLKHNKFESILKTFSAVLVASTVAYAFDWGFLYFFLSAPLGSCFFLSLMTTNTNLYENQELISKNLYSMKVIAGVSGIVCVSLGWITLKLSAFWFIFFYALVIYVIWKLNKRQREIIEKRKNTPFGHELMPIMGSSQTLY